MSAASSRRAYRGPAVLSAGFRPFFLAGAVWAVAAVFVWLPQYFGEFFLVGALAPLDWHAHEAIFGYGGAVVAGFLLTAVPNWTGRPPIQGAPLAGLWAIWLCGRIALLMSDRLGWLTTALIDGAFLATLTATTVRELVAGKSAHNLKVAGAIAALWAANVGFHIEAHLTGSAEYSRRLGVALLVTLILLIGGRVVPSFTHSYLSPRPKGRMPPSFGRFDALCMIVSALALAGWVAEPDLRLVGLALIGAGLLNFARLSRWAGERTMGEPLALVLHLAFAFAPLGFVLSGLAAWTSLSPSVGVHAWAVGAIGGMTLAIMTRASLGHTGQRLHAGMATRGLYLALLLAAAARIGAALKPEWSFVALHVAAFAWLAAFGGFALVYAPALVRPRAQSGG